MEVKQIEIPYKYSEPIHLYTWSCFHGGTLHCSEKKIKAKIQEVKNDPYGWWIDLGDKGEFITPSDPRWDAGGICDWVHQDNIAEDQAEWYMDMVSPIQKQCLGLLEGNHEDAIRIHSHVDVHKNICKRLNVADLGNTCFLILSFKRKNSTESHEMQAVFSHGAGWAITKGSKMNRLERFMNTYPRARICGIGHMHDLITLVLPYLDVENGNIVDRERVGAVVGCYFTTYSQGIRASYGEKKDYPPTQVGSPRFSIRPSHNEVRVEVE